MHLFYIGLRKLCCVLKHHSRYILRLSQSLINIQICSLGAVNFSSLLYLRHSIHNVNIYSTLTHRWWEVQCPAGSCGCGISFLAFPISVSRDVHPGPSSGSPRTCSVALHVAACNVETQVMVESQYCPWFRGKDWQPWVLRFLSVLSHLSVTLDL